MDTTSVNYTADSGASTGGAVGGLLMLVLAAMIVMMLILIAVSNWRLFTKAGRPGWASIVPFYNIFVMVEIVGRPLWWAAVIILAPVINFVFSVIVSFDFVKSYGRGTGFAIFAFFFPFIAYPILAFDNSVKYVGPAATPASAPMAPGQPTPPLS